MKKNGFKVTVTVIACVLLMIGCFFLEWLVKEHEAAEQVSAMTELRKENSDGPNEGSDLSGVKRIENEEVVCYEDRAFYRFISKEDHVKNTLDMIKGVLVKCKKLEQVYVMPVPPRVLIEEGYAEDNVAYQNYINDLKQQMPKKSILLDVSDALIQHKDEAVFFRSENAWTCKGAYYGAQVFLNETQRECIPLEQYEEYVGEEFVGNMQFQKDISLLDAEELALMRNPLYYYRLKNAGQRAEVILFDNNGAANTYKKPLFTPSAQNLSSVIDDEYDRAIVDGESVDGRKADKYLLLICDNAGKLLVPYLKDYYAGVYVINIYRDGFLYNDISTLLEEYQITEVLWSQNAMELGQDGYYRALYDFIKEE